MGLDWMPGARPILGKESEFYDVLGKIKSASGSELEALNEELDKVSSFKNEVLEFAVAGVDPEADELLNKVYEEERPGVPFQEWSKQFQGKFIIDLPKPCDGIPKYSNGGFYEGVDFTSFRANFLVDCEEVIGQGLIDQAFRLMTASELCAYGSELNEKARAFAQSKNIDLGAVDWSKEDLDPPLDKLDIVLCAARYCLFWGGHGFYLHAWY